MSRKFEPTLGWLWWFIWEDDSLFSWVANIVLAFVLIKFVFYPVLGAMLGTSYPVVAVVSGSMEHDGSFDEWWQSHGSFYRQFNMTKSGFMRYSFTNGFNKGDIIILKGDGFRSIRVGDVVVFRSQLRSDPVIHRVIQAYGVDGIRYLQTKGDNNARSNPDELRISEEQYLGTGILRVPLLGWVKIAFVGLLRLVGLV